MDWFMNNLATIIIALLLLGVVILAVRTMVKDRKNGRCGNGCSGCSCGGECSHSGQQ